MKNFIIVIAVIGMLCTSAYADYECDTEYKDTKKRISSLTRADISDEAKRKWTSQLEKAYQLCKDGKKEQAAEIMVELRKEKEAEMVFSTSEGN